MILKNIHLLSQRSNLTAVFFLGLLVLSSCKKEEGDLGLIVQPEGDALQGNVVDTFSLITYSVLDDSLQSDNFSNNMIGSMVDPVFGTSQMGIYTQINLSSNNPVFDVPNTVVDSVVLSLVYQTYYGVNGPQTFKVYEVLDTMYLDSTYYSHSSLTTDVTDLVIGGNTQTPDYENYFHDIVTGDSAKPQLRLLLDNNLGQRFINESGTGNLLDNSVFVNWFRGLRIEVDNPTQSVGEGSIISMDMLDADSKLTIYYHETTTLDTLSYHFNINSNCARFTTMEHDYTGTPIEAELNDSTLGQNFSYVQAGAGLKVNIKFPTLLDLLDEGNIIINQAQLYLPVQYYALDPLVPAPRLIVFSNNADGSISVLQDQFEGDAVFGGFYDDANKAYVFSIGRYLQDVYRGTKPNLGLQLNVVGSSISAYRATLSGSNAGNRSKPYLKIIYTKF